MTRLTQYSEAFWGQDFLSTTGFEALSKHNSEEKKFLQDFEEYLRKRSRMEMEYSKSLGQLAKSLKDRAIYGVLELSWTSVRGELEACKTAHEEAGFFFSQHAEETKRFYREFTTRRDMVEDRIKKIQNQKSSQFMNVSKLSKSYRQKCRDSDHAKEAYSTLRREVTSTVKDLDRAKMKMEKSEDDVKKADAAYKSSVYTLEETRQDWEKEMEWACREFQDCDEEQIIFLRSEMWQAINRVSQTAFDVDESCERVRKVLETCDVAQDIQAFINHAHTGTEKPEPVVYQNYYNSNSNNSNSSSSNNHRGKWSSSTNASHHRAPLPPLPGTGAGESASLFFVGDEEEDPTYARADMTSGRADVTSGRADVTSGRADVTSGRADVTSGRADVTSGRADVTSGRADVTSGRADVTSGRADVTYSSADPAPEPSLRLLTVLRSFQSSPHFAVQVGETVKMVRKVSANMVEVQTHNNTTGNLPLACIKEAAQLM